MAAHVDPLALHAQRPVVQAIAPQQSRPVEQVPPASSQHSLVVLVDAYPRHESPVQHVDAVVHVAAAAEHIPPGVAHIPDWQVRPEVQGVAPVAVQHACPAAPHVDTVQ